MELEAHLPFWGELTREQREKLSRAAVERTFPQGTLVSGGSEDCTGLVLPLTGQLRAYLLTEEGRRVLEEEFERLQRQVADGARVLRGEDGHENP